MSKNTMTHEQALKVLNFFISVGIEFPDAVYKAASGTGYSIQVLTEIYDAQFEK